MTIDRRLLEAQLRQIAASADATKAAVDALLRQLAEEGPPGEARERPAPPRPPLADPPRRADDSTSPSEPAEPTPDKRRESSADEAAARLVAMKLALDGVPREEAEKKLAEQYELADPAALLAEVYEKAGK
jgi:hypothetical protein